MSFACDGDTPCPFAPLGKLATRLVNQLAQYQSPTWFLKSKPILHNPGHQFHNQKVPWYEACSPEQEDIWPCLFGQAEFVTMPSQCTCQPTKIPPRDLASALAAALFLHGNRTSPFLEPGTTPDPFEGHTVSVHVRAGDSCDVVTKSANQTSWALWPFSRTGARGTDWSRVRRYCVHPSVHLSALLALHDTRPIDRVLLATDGQDAVDLFRAQLPPGVELLTQNFDRDSFSRPKEGALTQDQYWIEYRSRSNATFAALAFTSGMEDLRSLARGSTLIGAMCGTFARMVHMAMVANHRGEEVPVISVDRCQPTCGDDLFKYHSWS